MYKRYIVLSEFFFKGATGQLIYDLSLELSKIKETIVFTNNKNFNQLQIANNKNLKVVARGLRTKKNLQKISHKSIKGLIFLIQFLRWVIFNRKNGDLYLIVSNPPFIGIAGLFLKLLGGKYIFLIQDLFPLTANIAGLINEKSVISSFFKYIIHKIIKESHKTIVLSEDLKKEILNNYCFKKKIEVIHNWAIEEIPYINKRDNPFIKKLNIENKFIIQYSGNFGLLHDLRTILETARYISDDDILFLFIGDGARKKEILKYKETYKINSIITENYQPREKIKFSLNASDISIISLQPNGHKAVMPSKFYGILQARKPIIFIGNNESFISEFIRKHNCGITFKNGDSKKLIKEIIRLKNDPKKIKEMGDNSYKIYFEKFGKKESISKYSKCLLD